MNLRKIPSRIAKESVTLIVLGNASSFLERTIDHIQDNNNLFRNNLERHLIASSTSQWSYVHHYLFGFGELAVYHLYPKQDITEKPTYIAGFRPNSYFPIKTKSI
jgi:hypothetical protein